MRHVRNLMLIICLLVGAACQGLAPTATPDPPTPTATTMALQPIVTPTKQPPSPTPQQIRTTPSPAPGPTTEIVPATTLPDPTIFPVSWDDRRLFGAGLLPAEQELASQLTGATVYHLQLSIDPSLTVVTGRLEALVTNQEAEPLHDLYFRLYPNILGGSLTVADVTLNGQSAISQLSTGATVLRVPLPGPLAPDEQVVVAMDFVTEVPQSEGGSYGMLILQAEILALAHFYPILAVYDESGWELELPSDQGDIIYADASYYLVELTTPAGLVTATSGVTTDAVLDADSVTEQIAAGPMRDFYLAASYNFVRQSDEINGITVNSYSFPEHEAAGARVLDYGRVALGIMNDQLGPYPYTEFDLVSTPTRALGIEYPGIVVIALRMYGPDNPFGEAVLESTVAHEVGHQWFYALVGNDQLKEPWLDESLTQYATWLYFGGRYGEPGAISFEEGLQRRFENSGVARLPIGLPAAAYSPPEYSGIVYGLGPIFFLELREQLGEAQFAAMLREYVAAFRLRIATPSDLQALAEGYCQCDLTPLFTEWVYGG